VGVKGSSTVEVFFAGMAINNVKQNGGTTSFGAGATHLAASQVDFTANVGDFSFTQYAIPGGTATDPVTGADGDQFTNALSDGAVVAWKAMTTTTASFTSLGSPNSANVAQFNPRNGSGGGRGAPTGSLTPTLTTYQFLASGANYSVTVSGSNTALAVVLTFDGIVPTGVTVTHHGNTVPLVGSVDNGSNLCSQIYGVANPDAGTNNVVVSWTGGQHVFVYALVFTGANQTTPFYGFSSNTNAVPSLATAGAVIQDTTPGDYGICIGSGTSGTAAPSGNTAFEDHTSGTTINAYGGYQFSFLGGDIYCGVTTASLISGGTAAACGVRQA
jgi:hypothetical protein